ncbi:unnamed protein product [Soboliphyme baturini]|uniref:Nucleolar protein 10 n=1 Tax=Soboliphyme baturini TaxID=241478 RepID=A0A3P7Z4A8_9BILA|nr:unnamed protein product [Soboliphyme baturini]
MAFTYFIVYNHVLFLKLIRTARFTPEDKFSKYRIINKRRFGLLLTQEPAPTY